MKFAKELQDSLVPEWQEKYLDYKNAKKKLKNVARAIRAADKSPGSVKGNAAGTNGPESLRNAPVYSWLNRDRRRSQAEVPEIRGGLMHTRSRSVSDSPNSHNEGQEDGDRTPKASAKSIPINERSPLRSNNDGQTSQQGRGMMRYGSIIGSPPIAEESPAMAQLQKQASLLELPDPALDPNAPKKGQQAGAGSDVDQPVTFTAPRYGGKGDKSTNGDARGGAPNAPLSGLDAPRYKSLFQPKRMNSLPGNLRPFVKRVFTGGFPSPYAPGTQTTDIALEAYRELDFRQAESFMFLDKQLEKIEDFYKTKENESNKRLEVLREQLHVMRNRRLEEIVYAERHNLKGAMNGKQTNGVAAPNQMDSDDDRTALAHRRSSAAPWLASVAKTVDQTVDKLVPGHVGKTSQALAKLGTPDAPKGLEAHAAGLPDHRDYSRKAPEKDVPYRVAKRKLKLALAEYYRGLELLKSYALLNRTAFRKINKKYDKAVNARPAGRYMAEKVNKAYFVNSDVVDGHITAVEDLYARYFERGNHKMAVGKLRAKIARAGDYTGSMWRQAAFVAAGTVFGIQGLVYGAEQLLQNDNVALSTTTSYLLQLYGGFFLIVFLSGFFVMDARAFTRAKVNYQFVFEFDNRNMLHWKELSELPAVFYFLLGLTIWLNFQQVGGMEMFIYWPVVLIGLSLFIFCSPLPFFYHQARRWFMYSLWRLTLAGIYPVEFRDFFLGDMFCSMTYAMGNIEVFFCLYARHWSHPDVCNSSHSRLLGFLTCLPGIWRGMQCLRRYYDTRNVFPHLVNGGKYTFTILGALSLSTFRMNKTTPMLAFFITCATVNSIYCSIWDVVMDWSLGVPSAKHKFLRETLAYKNVWWYYVAMCLDPILRFNWIFYVIYAYDAQHSSIVSFMIAFSEVCRRGMWTLFRVENEHCTNVGRFRASRDVPLPYEIDDRSRESLLAKAEDDDVLDARVLGHGVEVDGAGPSPPKARASPTSHRPRTAPASGDELSRHTTRTTGADLEHGITPISAAASLRRRQTGTAASSPIARALRRVGSTMLNAHQQDYERKRKPPLDDAQDDGSDGDDGSSESEGEAPNSKKHDKKPGPSQDDEDEDESRAEIQEAQEALSLAGAGGKT
ncbi:hypothetical protein B0A48_00976 [Cryoendolithus antarcticus]|uniref:SPX domain-containing protein n=1 Tax=Cryoendolithus antarcticus TaxID=1507870 RepID=A0A1V8TRX3_9PEZI|nr:hypothetical protein B0A48_00976 [Cryoendolithus antarcticus]